MKYSDKIIEYYHEATKSVFFKVPTKKRQKFSYYKARMCGKGIRFVVPLKRETYFEKINLAKNI